MLRSSQDVCRGEVVENHEESKDEQRQNTGTTNSYFTLLEDSGIKTSLLALTIWPLWYGTNSDRDNIHPLLTQLRPAGHCACGTATGFKCKSCSNDSHSPNHNPSLHWRYVFECDSKNKGLTEERRNVGFSGLFEDVDRAVKFWRSNRAMSKK